MDPLLLIFLGGYFAIAILGEVILPLLWQKTFDKKASFFIRIALGFTLAGFGLPFLYGIYLSGQFGGKAQRNFSLATWFQMTAICTGIGFGIGLIVAYIERAFRLNRSRKAKPSDSEIESAASEVESARDS